MTTVLHILAFAGTRRLPPMKACVVILAIFVVLGWLSDKIGPFSLWRARRGGNAQREMP